MFDLSGKTALVTGSSRGIGRAALLTLAQNGAKVIMHCRRPSEAAEDTLRALKDAGADYTAVYAELSEKDGADRLFRQLNEQGLSVDILVLNASIELRRKWTEISDEEYELQLDTNLRAPVKLLQKIVPGMAERGWGRIITVGSVQQLKPHEDMLIYSASKAALRNVALSLSMQLAPCGITVNNIAPGAIKTDRNAEALSDPVYAEHVRGLIPVRYIGRPDDISALILYLASEESKYMTGQDLYIDGGKSL